MLEGKFVPVALFILRITLNVRVRQKSLKIKKCLSYEEFQSKEEFEDTKGVIRIRITKNSRQQTQWPHENVQRDNKRSTKHT